MSERGVCLVTGGSRGIGAATARLAATRGYDVAITYRERAGEADAVVRDIEALGRRAPAGRFDVGDNTLRFVGAFAVRQRNRVATPCCQSHGGGTDAAAAAGDYTDTAIRH